MQKGDESSLGKPAPAEGRPNHYIEPNIRAGMVIKYSDL